MTDEKTLIADDLSDDSPAKVRGALPVKECPFCSEIHADEDGYCAECGLYRLGAEHATPEPHALASGTVAARLTLADGTAFELPEGSYKAGRADADVTINDAYMSRVHAEIRIESGKIGVMDLGSTNGTFVNGVRLAASEPRVLKPGDMLTLGKTEVAWEVFAAENEMNHSSAEKPGDETAESGDAPSDSEPALSDSASVGETDARPPSGWALVCTNREHPAIELWEGLQTLGRKPGKCDRVIEGDSFISGLHAEIEAGEDGVYLTDLGSTNGTIVNGTLLQHSDRTLLLENAAVAIGETEFVVMRR